MKIRKRSTWWCSVALLVTALAPAIVLADEPGKGLLRRKRITAEVKPPDAIQQNPAGDLWEKEAAQAELDAERILQGFLSMSVPSSPTPAPTQGPPLACLEGTTREDYFFDLLSPTTDRVLLRDPTTPQGMAYDWMLNQDPVFAVDPCYYPTTEQRYGLLTLYFATNGAQWTNSSGWLGGSSECTWAGVVCGTRRRKLAASPGRVYKLDLPFNNLAGTIPHEIVTLYEMENFNIFANSLTSSLPESIGTLERLIFLDAERNLLSGPLIPTYLTKLEKLAALRLSRNEFTGSVPTTIGQWEDLEQFWISNNRVVGTIPTQIGNLEMMKTMFLYDNSFEGNIPSQMGQLTELSILRLDGNVLEGRVPEEFYQLTNLEDLRLDGNFLEGSISPSIGKLTGLDDLRLSENLFTGSLPIELAALTNLQNLIIYKNYLNGTLPDIFSGYGQLEQLDVSKNFFTGVIPATIFAIPTVKFLYLSNNSFIGGIPSNFQDPPLLRDLYLDGNYLTGTIPDVQPGRLLELNEILFNYNLFQGNMPQSFCDLRLDAVLDDLFADCTGSPPSIVCSFPDCCNRCFDGSDRPPPQGRRKRTLRS